MDLEEKELHRQRIADFRYSVVAELCNPYLSEEERTSLIKEKVLRHHVIPHSTKTTISAETLRNWIGRYRRNGKEGLLPKPRTDRGRPRSFNDQEAEALIQLLENKPELTAAAAVAKLRKQRVITTEISSSSLSRFVQAHNLRRKDRLKERMTGISEGSALNTPWSVFRPMPCTGFPFPTAKAGNGRLFCWPS